MWKKYLIVGLISLVVGLFIGWLLTNHFSTPQTIPVPIHDTITRDSIQIKEVVKWKSRTVHDTIIEHSPIITSDSDTIQVPNDTIEIPIDHYEYEDSIVTDTSKVAWNIQYQGYRAKIDNMSISYDFNPTVPVVEKENGFGYFVGVGLSAGYGVGCATPVRVEPFVGVTVTLGWGYHWKPKKKIVVPKMQKQVILNDSIDSIQSQSQFKMQK